MKPVASAIVALAVVGAYAAVVHAQTPADRSIKYRQGVMSAQGWHLGVLASMAKGDRPYDRDAAVRSATFLDQLVAMPWDGYGPNTESGSVNTRAKAEIWKDWAKFEKYGKEVKAETAKLVSAAGTDLNALKGAVGATGKQCNGCHDDFRTK